MKTVLVVETEGSQGASLAAMLSDEYLVATVNRVHQALRFIEEQRVDGIVLELSGACGDGMAVLLSHVAGMRPKPGVVLLTSVNEAPRAVKAIKLGGDEYLVKPCDRGMLRTAVRRALAGRPHDVGTRTRAVR